MRGKAGKSQGVCQGNRITPAYAGKSPAYCLLPALRQDHPRLCGEKKSGNYVYGDYSRITPAYAGKRQPQLHRSDTAQDHPRLCGEKTKKIPKQRYFFHQPASFSFSLQYT